MEQDTRYAILLLSGVVESIHVSTGYKNFNRPIELLRDNYNMEYYRDIHGVCSGIDPTQRIECGFPGIKRWQCRQKGCCFDPYLAEATWCFQPKAQAICDPDKEFSCTNGDCIKRYQVCDGTPHCADISDESNCGFANWTPWSACSVSCGHGTKTRNRLCRNHDKDSCDGDKTETTDCIQTATCLAKQRKSLKLWECNKHKDKNVRKRCKYEKFMSAYIINENGQFVYNPEIASKQHYENNDVTPKTTIMLDIDETVEKTQRPEWQEEENIDLTSLVQQPKQIFLKSADIGDDSIRENLKNFIDEVQRLHGKLGWNNDLADFAQKSRKKCTDITDFDLDFDHVLIMRSGRYSVNDNNEYEIIFNIQEPVYNAEVGCYLDLDCPDNSHNVFCVYQKPMVISQAQAIEETLSTKFDTSIDVVCPENSDVYLTKNSYLNIITAIQSDKSSNARTGNCIICRDNDESFLYCQEKVPESKSPDKSAIYLQSHEQVLEVIDNHTENVNTKSEDVGDKNMEVATQQSFQSGSGNSSNTVEHPVLDRDTLEKLEDIPDVLDTDKESFNNVKIDQEKSIKLTASQEMMPETILYEKEKQDDLRDKHDSQDVDKNFSEPANHSNGMSVAHNTKQVFSPELEEITDLNVANPDELTEIRENQYASPSFEVIDQHPPPVSDNHVEILATKFSSDIDTITDDNSSNTPVLSIERDENLELIDKSVNNEISVQSDQSTDLVQNIEKEEHETEKLEAIEFHESIQEKLNKVHKALRAKARAEAKVHGERINEKLQEGIQKLNKTIEGIVEKQNSDYVNLIAKAPSKKNERKTVLIATSQTTPTFSPTTSIPTTRAQEIDKDSLVSKLSEKMSKVLSYAGIFTTKETITEPVSSTTVPTVPTTTIFIKADNSATKDGNSPLLQTYKRVEQHYLILKKMLFGEKTDQPTNEKPTNEIQNSTHLQELESTTQDLISQLPNLAEFETITPTIITPKLTSPKTIPETVSSTLTTLETDQDKIKKDVIDEIKLELPVNSEQDEILKTAVDLAYSKIFKYMKNSFWRNTGPVPKDISDDLKTPNTSTTGQEPSDINPDSHIDIPTSMPRYVKTVTPEWKFVPDFLQTTLPNWDFEQATDHFWNEVQDDLGIPTVAPTINPVIFLKGIRKSHDEENDNDGDCKRHLINSNLGNFIKCKRSKRASSEDFHFSKK